MKPKHVVAVVYVLAIFMNILDTTVVNVALPTLSREFEVGTASIDWVVTGYLLSLAVWIPASGWIGDRLGTKRVFLFALLLFTAASALCGLAQDLPQLIAARVLQGVGGGMLTPVGFAMLMRAFPPEERASVSRILIIPTALAPASGPVIGGFLTDVLSWRWVFLINAPVGLAAFAFGWLYLKEHREPRVGGLDIPGFLLSATSLPLALYALSQGPVRGWGSPVVLGTGIAGAVAGAAFVFVELRAAEPLIQLRLLNDRLFRGVMATSVFATSAFLGLLFVLPLFLQEVRGLSALDSGLTTAPEAVGVILCSQIGGRLYPRVGPRRLMAAGLTSLMCFFIVLTRVDTETNLWTLRAILFCMGGSMSFVFLPLQASAFARITPPDMGRASAIYNAQRQVASAVGVALLATILSVTLPAASQAGQPGFVADQVDAFHSVFVMGAVLAAAGIVMALRVRDEDAAATMRPRGSIVEAVASGAE